MARKPSRKQDDAGEQLPEVDLSAPKSAGASPIMTALLNAHRKQFGNENVLVAKDVHIYGVEPRSLALQYLLGLNVLPLQSLIAFSGAAKSYKTTALLEFMRMILCSAEMSAGVIINTEGKWSPDRASSLLRDQLDKTQYISALTNEMWQQAGSKTLTTLKQLRTGDETEKSLSNPFGSMPPVVIGIDSYTGAQTEKIQGEVHENGYMDKTFQNRAMQNWLWLNTWRPNLIGLPVAILVTQHLKDGIGGIGPVPTKVTAGGTAVGFMCDIEIRCSRIGEIEQANRAGATVKWKVHHNSLGPDRRELEIDIIEGHDENNDSTTRFEWGAALVNMLRKIQALPAGRGDRVKDVLGGEITEVAGKYYTCPALGVDEKTARGEKVTADLLAAKLEEYPQAGETENLRTRLQDALYIPRKAHVMWKASS